MRNAILGFFLGFTVTTVGFTGMSVLIDNGVVYLQNILKENAK